MNNETMILTQSYNKDIIIQWHSYSFIRQNDGTHLPEYTSK